jgi:hypothetical protein
VNAAKTCSNTVLGLGEKCLTLSDKLDEQIMKVKIKTCERTRRAVVTL